MLYQNKMRRQLQLAALTFALAATSMPAQFHFPSRTKKPQAEDITWLAPYATPDPGGRADALLHDPRFKSFLRDHLTAPQRFWNDNQSLGDTVYEFLSAPGAVLLEDNRFFTVDGDVPDFIDPLDGPEWIRTIMDYSGSQPGMRDAQLQRLSDWTAPGWNDHIAVLLDLIREIDSGKAKR